MTEAEAKAALDALGEIRATFNALPPQVDSAGRTRTVDDFDALVELFNDAGKTIDALLYVVRGSFAAESKSDIAEALSLRNQVRAAFNVLPAEVNAAGKTRTVGDFNVLVAAFNTAGKRIGTVLIAARALVNRAVTTPEPDTPPDPNPGPTPPPDLPAGSINIAKEIWGAVPSASSTIAGVPQYFVGAPLDGDPATLWVDANPGTYPDRWTLQLPGGIAQPIGRVVVTSGSVPYQLLDFEIQYGNDGTSWTTFAGGSFINRPTPTTTLDVGGTVTASWISVLITRASNAGDGAYSRIRESEVWSWGPPNNVPPAVTLTSPVPGTSIVEGGEVSITATVQDMNSNLSKVEFFDNGVEIPSSEITGSTNGVKNYNYGNITGLGAKTLGVKGTDSGTPALSTTKTVNITVTTNTPVPPPDPDNPAGDFAARVAAVGSDLVMAYALADPGPSDAFTAGRPYYNSRGLEPDVNGVSGRIDNGSLLLDLLEGHNSGYAGSWFANFFQHDTGQQVYFGPNTSFKLQFEIMHSPQILGVFRNGGEQIGGKLFDLNGGDIPGGPGEYPYPRPYFTSSLGKVVISKYNGRRFPFMYHKNTGGGDENSEVAFHDGTAIRTDVQTRGGVYPDRVVKEIHLDPTALDYVPDSARGIQFPLEWCHFQLLVDIGAQTGTWSDTYGRPAVTAMCRFRLYAGRENLPSELCVDWTVNQLLDGLGLGKIYLFHYFTNLNGLTTTRPAGNAWVRYRNLIVARGTTTRIPDPLVTGTDPAWLASIPFSLTNPTWGEIPNSAPMNAANVAACRPAWDPTGFNTYNDTLFSASWSGKAWDKRNNLMLSVSDGGHSVPKQSGIYQESIETGVATPVQESTRYDQFDPNGTTPPNQAWLGRAYFPDGRRIAAHSAYANQFTYGPNGERMVVLAYNSAVDEGPFPHVTTAVWLNRVGEKYDLNGSGWVPQFFGAEKYAGCAVDERTGKVWVWGIDGKVYWIDPRATAPRSWTLHASTGMEGHYHAAMIDVKRYRFISFFLYPNELTPPGGFGVKWVNTITGVVTRQPVTGTGVSWLAASVPYTQAVHDTINDEFILLACGPDWSQWVTINPTTWVATARGEFVHGGGDGMMGKAAFMQRLRSVVAVPKGSVNLQVLRRRA